MDRRPKQDRSPSTGLGCAVACGRARFRGLGRLQLGAPFKDDFKALTLIDAGIGGAVMPPPARGEGLWSQSRIDLLGKWIADGRPP
jgi:hypothetical protein